MEIRSKKENYMEDQIKEALVSWECHGKMQKISKKERKNYISMYYLSDKKNYISLQLSIWYDKIIHK